MELLTLTRAVVLTVSCAGLVACGNEGQLGAADPVIASVAGKPIFDSDLAQLWAQVQRVYASAHRVTPTASSSEGRALERSLIHRLVQREMFLLEARRLKIQISKRAIDMRLAKIKADVFHNSQAAYRRDLEDQEMTEDDLRNALRAQLIEYQLRELATRNMRVTVKSERAYFKSHRAHYALPVHRMIEFVVFTSKREANQFLKVARRSDRFPREFASMRQQIVAVMPTLARSHALSVLWLPLGRWSRPMLINRLWYAIRPTGKTLPGRPLTFQEARADVHRRLLQRAEATAWQRWLQRMASRYAARIRYYGTARVTGER